MSLEKLTPSCLPSKAKGKVLRKIYRSSSSTRRDAGCFRRVWILLTEVEEFYIGCPEIKECKVCCFYFYCLNSLFEVVYHYTNRQLGTSLCPTFGIKIEATFACLLLSCANIPWGYNKAFWIYAER